MLSARDADPGAHQKEKKSVLVDIIVTNPGRFNLTITLRSPYAWSLILNDSLESTLNLNFFCITHTGVLQLALTKQPG